MAFGRNSRGLCFALVLLAATVACTEPRSSQNAARYPLSRIEKSDGTIIAYPAEGVEVEQLVDLHWFGGLLPGCTFKDAEKRLGVGYSERETEFGTVREFRLSDSVVAVGRETQRSGVSSYDLWTLRAFPKNAAPVRVFDSGLIKELGSLGGELEIRIMGSQGPDVVAHLSQGKVKRLLWLRGPKDHSGVSNRVESQGPAEDSRR